MESFLERYQQGERLAVWAELTGLGAAVREEPFYGEARAVALEMMNRARHNVALLVERLRGLEYRFAYPDRAWIEPVPGLLDAFHALEKNYGPLPVTLSAWFETVGTVNFMGAHPKLSRMAGSDWGGSEQLKRYTDPMLVSLGGPGGLVSFYLNRVDSEEEEARMEEEMPPPYGFGFGLSAINKAGHSGSGSTDILVPSPAFDAPIIDSDDYWMGAFFVSYLRTCFEWGGFPGLRPGSLPSRPDDQWDPSFAKAELDLLRKDLLPL